MRSLALCLALLASCAPDLDGPKVVVRPSGAGVTAELRGVTRALVAEEDAWFPAGTRIRTGEAGAVVFGDGALLRLLPWGVISIEATAPPTRTGAPGAHLAGLRLEAGSLAAKVLAGPAGITIRSDGGDVTLDAPGELSVRFDARAVSIRVEVLHGRAVVRSSGSELTAGSGMVVRAARGAPPVAQERIAP